MQEPVLRCLVVTKGLSWLCQRRRTPQRSRVPLERSMPQLHKHLDDDEVRMPPLTQYDVSDVRDFLELHVRRLATCSSTSLNACSSLHKRSNQSSSLHRTCNIVRYILTPSSPLDWPHLLDERAPPRRRNRRDGSSAVPAEDAQGHKRLGRQGHGNTRQDLLNHYPSLQAPRRSHNRHVGNLTGSHPLIPFPNYSLDLPLSSKKSSPANMAKTANSSTTSPTKGANSPPSATTSPSPSPATSP